MALGRLALRLASIEALNPGARADDDPLPTLAGNMIYDSAFDPIDDLDPRNAHPIVVVMTDDDDADAKGPGGYGPPFLSTVDLCFDVSVVVMHKEEGAAEYEPACPQEDGELAASLDLLEAQLLFALFNGPSGKLWRKMTARRVLSYSSTPHFTGEERIRLARRTVKLKVQIADDAYDPAPLATPEGIARLPEPLRTVVAGLVENGYGAKLGAGLAGLAPVMPLVAPLDRVTLNLSTAAADGSLPLGEDDQPIVDTQVVVKTSE
jgi:hypothetical protein